MPTPDSPAPRVTRRRLQTRARLLDAAFDVFAAVGFGQASIEGICEAAGYTRGAFYSNFTDLDELFFALYDAKAELIARQLSEALAEAGPVFATATASDQSLPQLPEQPELLRRVVDALLLDRDWLLVKTEFLLHAARRPAVAEALAAHRATLRATVAQRLGELAERRQLPPLLADPDTAAHAVIAVHDGVTAQLILDGDTAGARTALHRMLTTLLTTEDPHGR